MRLKTLTGLALAFALVLGSVAEAGTIAYPTTKKPHFLIDVPDDWELEQAEEPGGFFTVSGPSGVVLSFRTVEGGDLDGAIEESMNFLKENYKNVKLEPAEEVEQDGMSGAFARGTGVDKNTGAPGVFAMAWFELKNGEIAEIWYAADAKDKKGADQASKVLDSFRAK